MGRCHRRCTKQKLTAHRGLSQEVNVLVRDVFGHHAQEYITARYLKI
jgi:hypothetical protein